MKRLTQEKRNFDGTGVSKRPLFVFERSGVSITDYAGYILTRLADYEDTGLTPEQIMELRERDSEKAPTDTDVYFGYFECPSCGMVVYASDDLESHKFCLNCGQRIKWESGS